MKATEQLAANTRPGRAFLVVSGASGSGKSSLAKAGMVPRLMKPQFNVKNDGTSQHPAASATRW
jgi:ABC-type bacteriocin/lantibiotic exporter with double-glycine peptidase domain